MSFLQPDRPQEETDDPHETLREMEDYDQTMRDSIIGAKTSTKEENNNETVPRGVIYVLVAVLLVLIAIIVYMIISHKNTISFSKVDTKMQKSLIKNLKSRNLMSLQFQGSPTQKTFSVKNSNQHGATYKICQIVGGLTPIVGGIAKFNPLRNAKIKLNR